MLRMLEIRAAEGGEDSKLFVNDLAQAYLRLAQRAG
jgi:protein subunit release factor A